ncbi:hypothetical protein [Arenibacter sp. ARW7G5Y1]|uniref:hypothetical protein n=1 Tax=Arenibacter sp. ARW7G5Y1 TaxID=2135619 RepID=UPI000D76D663|nr:hypothetical protein [Arenibacter sp. ARW7G5Y1]PXX21667.1 hypothetical protein C7972_13114 [Arenibacter sp. ARW7G5Y1]
MVSLIDIEQGLENPTTIGMGVLPNLIEEGGFTVDIWFETKEFIPNQIFSIIEIIKEKVFGYG